MMDMTSKIISNFDKERQFQTYSIFRKLISGKIHSAKARAINRSIAYLKKRHELNKEDIFIRLFERYEDRQHYRKFKKYPGGLEQFIADYLYRELNGLKNWLDQDKIEESTERICRALRNKNNEQELLSHAYLCFQWILAGHGYFAINRKIRKKMETLTGKYRISHQEILFELFEDFRERKLHLRYDSRLASMRTFISHHVNYRLSDKIRGMKRLDREIKVGGYDDDALRLAEGISLNDRLHISGLQNNMTPEKILIDKQLIEHLVKFLGEDDAKVLFGITSRKSEAERKGMRYDAYCKRLRRKLLDCVPEFEKAGYC